MRWIILSITILVVCCWTTDDVQSKDTVSKSQKETLRTQNVVDAINEGKVKVEAEGAGLSAVKIRITRETAEKMKILIPLGTFFVNRGKSQDMVVTESAILDLTKRKELTYSIPAACANADRDAPYSSSKFDIRLSPPFEALKKLIVIIGKKKVSKVIKQVAVWIVTDNISRAKLDTRYRRSITGGYAASNEDVIKAMQIVEEAGIDISRKAISRVSAIRALSSKDQMVLEYASKTLGIEIGDRIELLKKDLKNRDWTVRRIAARVMGEIKDDQAVDPLIDALTRESAKTKSYMLYRGMKLETTQTQENKEHEQVVLAIARALGEIGDEHAIDPLINASRSMGSSYYYIIAGALVQINKKHPKVVQHLIADLGSSSYIVRGGAAEVLGNIKEKQAVERLIIALLKDISPDVRKDAARALGQIQDNRAIEPLIDILNDKNKSVQQSAAYALEKMTGKNFGSHHTKWKAWWEQNKESFLKAR